MPRKSKEVSSSPTERITAPLPARQKAIARLAIYLFQQGINCASRKHRNNFDEIIVTSDETVEIEYDENGKMKKEIIVRSVKYKAKIITISVVGAAVVYYIYK